MFRKEYEATKGAGETLNAAEKQASLLRMYTDRWQTLTGKRKIRNQRRNFEEMLMTELPGAAEKTNLAMHAVLESELDDDIEEEEEEEDALERRGQLKQGTPLTVRNHALLHYFANLARSNNFNDKMDFAFVQSLVKNGASINTADKHGQTVFHEVARSWHTDVAKFLLNNGADLNKVDKFGRSPLHVAAAVDYVDMVEFLLENGACVDAKTSGECQTPLHFAAKNDAVNAMKMLLAYDSDINCTDYKNRTPLQVAAELNRAKSSTFLINESASAAVSDSQGNSVISLLIERLPSVALKALDQFHLKDRINRKQYFYLNCLEPCRGPDGPTRAKTPLEVAVLHNQSEILLHPVFQRLINVKWEKYGKIRAWSDLLMNVFYAIFWTILCVTQAKHPRDHYYPLGDKWWRIALEIIVFLFTCYEARKQFSEIYGSRKEHHEWIVWKTKDLSRDKEFCHPRWPEEMRYLEQELKSLRGQRALLFKDAWNHFEWMTCTILLATVLTYLVNYFYHSDSAYTVHMRVAVGLLIALWLRIMKYARPFRHTGPFVIILGHIAADFFKWGFLFFIIYIPYAASFWMVFGGVNPSPVDGYGTVSELLFNVFRMTVVDQYNFDGLASQDANMAKLLCGTYIALSAVIILNILIALLSHTFQRVYDNAKSNAVMQKANIILNLERALSKKRRKKLHEYINAHCSPEVLPYDDEYGESEVSVQATNKNILEEVGEMFHVVNASLGKRSGRKAKSDFDAVIENVKKVRKSQQDLQEASLRIRVHLMKLENFLQLLNSPSEWLGTCRTSRSSQKESRGGTPRRTENEKTSSPIQKEARSLPLRRKCGVSSLQHDPQMYTSLMNGQGSLPLEKRFVEQDEHKLTKSSPVNNSTLALPKLVTSMHSKTAFDSNSAVNSGANRNGSVGTRRKKKLRTKRSASGSQASSKRSRSSVSVNGRELSVNDREMSVNERELSVNEREMSVNDRELSVNERELSVNDRELSVNERELSKTDHSSSERDESHAEESEEHENGFTNLGLNLDEESSDAKPESSFLTVEDKQDT